MGLDNGIEIKRRDDLPEVVLTIFDEEWCRKYNYDLKVAYWRKCGNVRCIIFGILDVEDDNDSDTPVSREDLARIIQELELLNLENYEDYGSTIWEWEEFESLNSRNLEKMRLLYNLMEEFDLEVYFYDSW